MKRWLAKEGRGSKVRSGRVEREGALACFENESSSFGLSRSADEVRGSE